MTEQEPQNSSNTTPDSVPRRGSMATPESFFDPAGPPERPAPPASNDERSTTVEDSPDLLRWRADILLDEMMLGAVDTGAGHGDAQGSARDAARQSEAGLDPPQTHPTPGYSPPSFSASQAPTSKATDTRPDVAEPAPDRSAYPSAVERPAYDPWQDRTYLTAPEQRSQAQSTGGSRQDGGIGTEFDAVSEFDAVHVPYDRSALPDDLRRPYAATQSSQVKPTADNEALLRPPSATQTVAPAVPETVAPRRDAYEAERAQRRRNNLLPRMSRADVAQLRQQITALTADVERLLPAGHDWYTRSEHLLERADHILRNTPERSAEVEYYLQQIRAIIGRAQQTNAASQVYRRRLAAYHVAWLALSAIVLAAYIMFTPRVIDWMVVTFRLRPDGFLAGNLAALMATLAAATLGAALGGLVNMQRYQSHGRGFFDRKYSLRGLFLPVFALLVAVIVYGLASLVFWLIGVDVAQQPLWTAVPAGLALLYGFWQEHVYGTAP